MCGNVGRRLVEKSGGGGGGGRRRNGRDDARDSGGVYITEERGGGGRGAGGLAARTDKGGHDATLTGAWPKAEGVGEKFGSCREDCGGSTSGDVSEGGVGKGRRGFWTFSAPGRTPVSGGVDGLHSSVGCCGGGEGEGARTSLIGIHTVSSARSARMVRRVFQDAIRCAISRLRSHSGAAAA